MSRNIPRYYNQGKKKSSQDKVRYSPQPKVYGTFHKKPKPFIRSDYCSEGTPVCMEMVWKTSTHWGLNVDTSVPLSGIQIKFNNPIDIIEDNIEFDSTSVSGNMLLAFTLTGQELSAGSYTDLFVISNISGGDLCVTPFVDDLNPVFSGTDGQWVPASIKNNDPCTDHSHLCGCCSYELAGEYWYEYCNWTSGDCDGGGGIYCHDGTICELAEYIWGSDCYDCPGNCTNCEVDECGTCDGSGIPEGDCDCDGNVCDCTEPCDRPSDIACGGNWVTDECDECVSPEDNTCVEDCDGVWGGNGGFTSTCCDGNQYCVGDSAGGSYDGPLGATCFDIITNDVCGVCGGTCIEYGVECPDSFGGNVACDCYGNVELGCGCNSEEDLGCGCGEPGPSGCNDCCDDTDHDCTVLENDTCGVCDGGNADDLGCGCFEDAPSGCNNICGSYAEIDDCGVCGGGNADDLGCGCFEDAPSGCDNVCGSTLEDDECGDCGGDGPFQCSDGSYECNSFDCGGGGDFDFGIDLDLDFSGQGSHMYCIPIGECQLYPENNPRADGDALIDDACSCNGCDTGYECCWGWGQSGEIGFSNPTPAEVDCASVCGGSAVFDECGVCGGDGSSCADCVDVNCDQDFYDSYGACGLKNCCLIGDADSCDNVPACRWITTLQACRGEIYDPATGLGLPNYCSYSGYNPYPMDGFSTYPCCFHQEADDCILNCDGDTNCEAAD